MNADGGGSGGGGGKKPGWIRGRMGGAGEWGRVERTLRGNGLRTVCEEARCPNRGECWGRGTATFLILGDVCTRSCGFCAVKSGRVGREVDPGEGAALARAVGELGLGYVVITSVDRDDLADRGAGQYAACVEAVKGAARGARVEALTPDFSARELEGVVRAGVDTLAHNVETVRRLQEARDARAGFDRSLATLRAAKAAGVGTTKSSLMLGLGERPGEVVAAMDDLREAGVDALVLGQYLRPSPRQIPVVEFVHPDMFAWYAVEARSRGFASVVSAPLARTSYHADGGSGRPWPPGGGQGGGAPLVAIHAVGKPPGCKLIRFDALYDGERLWSVRIRGDFFASPEEEFDRVEAALSGVAPRDLAGVFDGLLAARGVEASGVSGAGLAEVAGHGLSVSAD